MGGLKRRDDTLQLGCKTEANKSLGVSSSDVLGTFAVFPAGQLRSDTRVVKTSRDRVSLADLSVLVLENVGADTMEHTLGTTRQGSAVAGGVDAVTTSLDTKQLNGRSVGEGVEHADGVRATSNAGYDSIWKLATLLLHLLLGLVTDDRLEGADDGRERMRTDRRSNDVVSSVEIDDPGSHSLVDRITEGLRTSFDCNDRCSEQLDTED